MLVRSIQPMRFAPVWQDDSEVFRHRRARPIARWERCALGILLFLGAQGVILFALWWFRAEHVGNLFLFVLLSLATWYGVSRIVVGWYNAFHLEQPPPRDAPAGLSVAIFITSS